MGTCSGWVTVEAGQGMVEYGVIVAVIAAVCIGAFHVIGQQVLKALDSLIQAMK